MVITPAELKKRRRDLGLGQKELARALGLSQGLISKFEAERNFPGYHSLLKMEEGLFSLESRQKATVESLMVRSVYSVLPGQKVREVISVFKKKAYSQAPLLEGGTVVGLITSTGLLSARPDDLIERYAEDAPPSIPPKIPVDYARRLLRLFPILIVSQKGKMVGIVSREDVLGA